MYEYTDKILKVLTKKYIRAFGSAKGYLLPMDEINILTYSKKMYRELEQFTEKYLLMLARQVYLQNTQLGNRPPTKKWLHRILSEYDPVTLYVYLNEVERKESRFAEGVIAAVDRGQEVDKALRLWSNMIKQYAITVTDKAALRAYKDNGILQVEWITVRDEKRCKECRELDGQIFDIDDVPPKPHLYCRCRLMPYIKGNKDTR